MQTASIAATERAPHRTRRGDVRIRAPRPDDAQRMWNLVHDSDALDLNSPYAYLLLCRDFSDTCLVAEAEEGRRLVGFVAGYRPPHASDTMFVWQVGVSSEHRQEGLARRLIIDVLDGLDDVRFLEATVTPSNEPSWRLFRSVADRLGADFRTRTCFDEELFPESDHEPEELVRIGPL